MADVRSDADLREDLKQLRIVSEREEIRTRAEEAPRAKPRRRRFRPLRWLLLLALILGGVFAFQGGGFEPPEVTLVPVTRRDLGVPPIILTAVGYVVPRREITVSSKAQGKIVAMPVQENQRVKEGDLLVQLENEQVQANLQLAQARLADARRELDLNRALVDKSVRPRSFLDRARTLYDIAEAEVAFAKVAVEDTTLRAPFAGTIVRKLRDVGEFLTLGVTAEGDPGTAVVDLADLEQIEVELEINETEIGKIRSGMSALVIPEARPRSRYEGIVVELAPKADRRQATVNVRVRILEPDSELLPDMTANVRFLLRAPPGPVRVMPTVPRTAIAEYENREVVWVAEDGKVRPVSIRLDQVSNYMEEQARSSGGAAFVAFAGEAQYDDTPDVGADNEFVALLQGPSEGDYVVERPPAGLEPGDAVRIVQ